MRKKPAFGNPEAVNEVGGKWNRWLKAGGPLR